MSLFRASRKTKLVTDEVEKYQFKCKKKFDIMAPKRLIIHDGSVHILL